MVAGHEFGGRVVSRGHGVEGFPEAAVVASGAGISCGQCPACARMLTNFCEQYFTVGLQRNGALAQYVTVPASICLPVEEHGLDDDGAALVQPMSVAHHALRQGSPQPGDTVVVIGIGGVGAFLVTLMYGVRRGLFSNEAGQGSAPIAHSAAKTEEPVSEGVVALLEPFIDTIIICTMTGLLIIMTGVWHDRFETEITLSGGDLSYRAVQVDGGYVDMTPDAPIRIDGGEHAATGPDDPQISWHEVPVPVLYVDEAHTQPFSGVIDPGSGTATGNDGQTYTSLHGMAVESGAPLTMAAFRRGLAPLGDWGHYIVVLSVLLFGISTAIAWSYYGDRCANYLFGARALIPYKVVFVIMHFVGAVLPLSVIWAIGDVFLAIVIWPNLIALGLLAPKVVEMTCDYFERKPWEAK